MRLSLMVASMLMACEPKGQATQAQSDGGTTRVATDGGDADGGSQDLGSGDGGGAKVVVDGGQAPDGGYPADFTAYVMMIVD